MAALLKDTRAEALVIAGDLYDRAVPPKEAVALLDQTLDRILRGLGGPVLIIASNHDNPNGWASPPGSWGPGPARGRPCGS